MQLYIFSPIQKKNLEIKWIELQTPVGSFVIQSEHAPMVVTLSPGSMATFDLGDDKQESILIKTGVAHITRESVTLLLNDI